MLKPLLLPFKLGIAGRLGSGRQWMPWISLADWTDAVVFLLDRDDLAGPVNLVGPAPVTNAEFTRDLAAALHRPAVDTRSRGPALRIALGEFAHVRCRSARVLPGVLGRAGFTYRHETLPAALRAALHS